eukprot:761918-Lingulodinium_polyedra.AAC.1
MPRLTRACLAASLNAGKSTSRTLGTSVGLGRGARTHAHTRRLWAAATQPASIQRGQAERCPPGTAQQ